MVFVGVNPPVLQASHILPLLDGGLTPSAGLVVLVSRIAADSHGCQQGTTTLNRGQSSKPTQNQVFPIHPTPSPAIGL